MERLILPYLRIFLFIVLFSFVGHASAQVAISTRSGNTSPDPTAVLLLVGDGTQGLIIPTITNIATSVPGTAGMMAYSAGKVYYSDGSNWTAVGGGSGSQGILINGNIVQIGTGGSFTSQFLLSNTPPTSGVQRGQLLQWDGATNQWSVTKDIGAALTDGQVLSWSASQNRWEPRTPSVGGGGGISTINKGGAGSFISITNPTGPITTINADAIVDGDISGSANISGTKLQDGTLPVTKLSAGTAINGQFLRFNAGSWAPATIAIPASVTNVTATAPLISSGGTTPNISLSGTLPVANGGTGRTTWDGVLWGNGTGSITDIGNGTNGQVFTMQGTSPGWSPAPSSFTTTNVLPKGSVGGLVASSIFDDGANVGIGTTTPSHRLTLFNPTAFSLINFQSTATGTSSIDGFMVGLNQPNGESIIYNWENQDMLFGTNGAERMRLTAAGNVGVGTTAPSGKLHVEDAAWAVSPLQVSVSTTASNVGPAIRFSNAESGNHAYDIIGSTGSGAIPGVGCFTIWDNTSGGYRFVINQAGNVGIGTTAPSQKLHVLGNILASGTITPSDSRLKENIFDLRYGLKEVLKLRPVSYNWKSEPDGKKVLGLIAQETLAITPEIIELPKSEKEFYAMNYVQLIPVLIKATQEQQAIIETQQSEINNLKKELDQIKNYLGMEAKAVKKKKGKK
jgi:hypothetical protein